MLFGSSDIFNRATIIENFVEGKQNMTTIYGFITNNYSLFTKSSTLPNALDLRSNSTSPSPNVPVVHSQRSGGGSMGLKHHDSLDCFSNGSPIDWDYRLVKERL